MAAVTLGELGRADLTTWNDSRLRVWCRMIPLILLSAIPQSKRPDLADLPGKAGGYSTDEIESAAAWMATAQVEKHGSNGWHWLAHWALFTLYPEYKRRTGSAHACDVRVAWLSIACAPALGEEW